MLGGVLDAGGPSASGSVTATFTWQPDPNLASDPPPKFVYVAETASAGWGFIGLMKPGGRVPLDGVEGGSPFGALRVPNTGSAELTLFKPSNAKGRFIQVQSGGSGSASNGLGNKTVTAPDGRSGHSSGTRLKKYDSTGGTVTTDSVSPSASASSSDPNDSPQTSWTYSAQITDFGVFRSTGKGAVDMKSPNFNKDRDEYIDEDGVRYGHTTYSYNYASLIAPLIKRSYYNWQTFGATLGSWANGGKGAWSPPSDDDTNSQHRQDMPFGSLEMVLVPNVGPGMSYEWSGEPNDPQQKIITYTFTDTANTTNTARYNLTVHDAWELGPAAPTDKDINPYLGQPIPIGFNYEPSNPGTAPKILEYVIDISKSEARTFSNSVSVEASAGASGEAGGSLPALKKKGIDAKGKLNASLSTSIISLWNMTEEQKKEFSFSDKYPITLQPGESAHPVYYIRSHHQEFQMWHFGELGYLGESHAVADTYDDIAGAGHPVVFGWSKPVQIQDPKANQP